MISTITREQLPTYWSDRFAGRFTDLGGILYLTGSSNPSVVVAAATQPRLGMLAQPGNNYHRHGTSFARWGVDNGAFGVALQHYNGKRGEWSAKDTTGYLAYLDKVQREVKLGNLLFATAPDVLKFIDNPDPVLAALKKSPLPIGDAAATWMRSRPLFGQIRRRGMPAALVAQDGILAMAKRGEIAWGEFDVLFLGGSDHFKLGAEGKAITKVALDHGKWVHMGRVNSLKRFQIASGFGCQSADGTLIGFGPDKHLKAVLSWFPKTTRPAQGRAA